MAEVERLKKPKVLTVQSLRQEMVDRRGTSVNLLKKEYVNFRKKRNEKRKSKDEDELQQFDFGALLEQKGLGFQSTNSGNEAADIFGLDEQPKQEPRSDGLGAKLSRWVASEGVTDLDDLATVVNSPARPVNLMGAATAFAKNAAAHLPDIPNTEELNSFARDAGKGINTIGTNLYGAGQTMGSSVAQVGGRAGRTIGQGAHVVGTGIGHGLNTVGQGVSLVAHNLPPVGLPTVSEMQESNGDGNMFSANFSDMILTSIEEDEDDDDDFGLLASHIKDLDNDDDNFSFHSSHSKRSYNSESVNVAVGSGGGARFKMGMLKAPNLGKTMKKLIPSMPKRDSSRVKSSNGFMMDDDGYGSGLLG